MVNVLVWLCCFHTTRFVNMLIEMSRCLKYDVGSECIRSPRLDEQLQIQLLSVGIHQQRFLEPLTMYHSFSVRTAGCSFCTNQVCLAVISVVLFALFCPLSVLATIRFYDVMAPQWSVQPYTKDEHFITASFH